MPVLSWVRELFGAKTPKTYFHSHKPSRKSNHRARLTLETLESRLTPSTVPTATLQLLSATAQGSPHAVTLMLDSYEFGFRNATTLGSATSGAGAGKARFDDLVVTAPINANTPELFKAVTGAKSFAQAVLTQNNAAGAPIAVWTLKSVYASSDKVDGDAAATPKETLHFTFAAVTEATSAITTSWDQSTNSTGSPAPPPPGTMLAAIPTPIASTATLQLFPTGSGTPLPAFELPDWSFDISNKTTIGSATAGAGGGKAKFNEVEITKSFSSDSPKHLAAVTAGSHYDHAVLTQNNAAGQPIAVWTLTNVFNTLDDISAQSGKLPSETLHFAFGALTEAVKTDPTTVSTASWDQVRHVAGTPAPLPTGITLAVVPTPAAPPITLTITAHAGTSVPVTITLNSYNFGFQKLIALGASSLAAGSGPTKFSELEVNAAFGTGSPLLFKALTSGGHFDQAVLTQNNAAGQPVAVWTLNTVYVTSEKISKSADGSVPTEQVHFAFNAVTQATSAGSSSWNQVTHKAGTPAGLPTGVTLAAIPGPTAPAVTLQLTPSAANSAPLTIAVNAYHFGFADPVNIGSSRVGVAVGKTRFDDLIVTADLGAYAPKLLQALVAGTAFSQGVLTQNDSAGHPIAIWTLKNVYATSDQISDAGAVPTEVLHFVFEALTEATKANSTSWDRRTNSAGTAASPPAGTSFDAIPVPIAPSMTLELTPGAVDHVPALTVALNTYQFGFTNSTTFGWSGASPGKTKLNELEVTAAFAANSPLLLQALTLGAHYETGRLTQRDAAGHVIAVWTLSTVFVTSDQITGNGNYVPSETLHFAFRAVTEATSASHASWDQAGHVSPTPAPLPVGVTISPIPAPTAPSITLVLTPLGKTPVPITIAVNTYDFAFQRAKTGKTRLSELTITSLVGANSPQLLQILAKGDHYASALLVQRNSAGQPVAAWTLSTVFVTADTISSNGDGVPTEIFKFAFNAANETTSAVSNSWDQVHNDIGSLASLFDRSKLVPITAG